MSSNKNISFFMQSFCGDDNFMIWNEAHHNFGLCFQKTVFFGLSYSLLAICSAFYVGKQTSYFIRNKTQKAILVVRIIICILSLLLTTAYPFVLVYYGHVELHWVDIYSSFIQVLSWVAHFFYLFSLRHYLSRGTRGPRPVIISWALTIVCDILFTRTLWSIKANPWAEDNDYFVLQIQRSVITAKLSLQVVYMLTLFPSGRSDRSPIQEYSIVNEQTPLISSAFPSYIAEVQLREVFDPYNLGIAEDGVNWLSFLTFYWVTSLMQKGSERRIESNNDLFELPNPLKSEVVSQKVHKHLMLSHPLTADKEGEEKIPKRLLLKALHKCFGKRFYAIGILKFVSDALNYGGPLLLHFIITYVEDSSMATWKGVVAGVGICLTSLVGAFCLVHFNYFLSKIMIQLRAAVITTVYRKIQQLNLSSLYSEFTEGEIVNLMSTDTDRIINFCTSFHAFWSLPLQLIVTFYLLYVQIGSAFLAGVFIAVILIPLNRLIAVKIGELSTTMMRFKDKRITLMADVLNKIKELKFNAWEGFFKTKIMDERFGEVEALAGRKYLDAGCVFFWASSPVLIPIVTFVVYAFLGNVMEPAKIFTAVALFSMLITPLNAFPWVINGLVEAWISLKRVERLLLIKDFSFNEYYTVIPEGGYQDANVQIVIVDGTFSWKSNNTSDKERGQDETDIVNSSSGEVNMGSERESLLQGDGNQFSPKSHSQGVLKKIHSSDQNLYSRDPSVENTNLRVSDSCDTDVQDSQTRNNTLPSGSEILKKVNNASSSSHEQNSHSVQEEDTSQTLPAVACSSDSVPKVNYLTRSRNSTPRSDIALKNISITVLKNQKIAVIGNVGSGKTALLYSILGELNRISGVVSVSTLHEGFGVATQTPWLENITIRENILFGNNLDVGRYSSVLYSCALEEDLKCLNKGDLTKAGENGSSLSGGQKARVALARSIYQAKSVYLLDDVLSSVDAPVAKQIMNRCIFDFLSNKTVILVTHHVHLLKNMDCIIYMKNGRIFKQGTPDEIIPYALSHHEQFVLNHQPSSSSGAVPRSPLVQRKLRFREVAEEKRVPSREGTFIYKATIGVTLVILTLLSFVLMQTFRNLVDGWLAKWVSNYSPINTTVSYMENYEGNHNASSYIGLDRQPMWSSVLPASDRLTSLATIWDYKCFTGESSGTQVMSQKVEGLDPVNKSFLIVYLILAAGHTLFTLLRAFIFAFSTIRAAVSLHSDLLESILHAKIGFFDLNPIGRILNRFSTDVYTIDDSLPFQANIFLAQLFGIFGSIIITIYGLPWIFMFYLPLLLVYYKIQEYYRHTSRDIRRIYALSLSPLYSHFASTIVGLPIIRSLRAGHRYKERLDRYLEQNQRAQFGLQVSSQWLNFQLQMLGLLILAGVVALGLWQHHSHGIGAGIIGLVLVYAMNMSGQLNGVVTSFTETERELVSVERVHQYLEGTRREGQNGVSANLLAEFSPMMIPTPVALPYGWPNQGQIVFENVHLKYHEHNPYSLRNVNFSISSCEKVGIVGRTGAGKSSIFIALFRIVELTRGKIFIDNVDISDISIKKLRNENIDEEIMEALEHCGLTSLVNDLGGLDALLKSGKELSAGERQLFCLARALLTRVKIVCLDEGTSQLDSNTEMRIQKVVREVFRNKTILISSHRMYCIKDCSKVIVLDEGEVVEVGSPEELDQSPNSLFHKIIHKSHY
ncbi:Multidrug resistance-associated protein 7 [Armadillidium nasatum]|uniref:ABC-type xenobiotic transporter n=1 Tax=Armadillidium nasatum TaxID=96803 RepID=A0A5N5TE54_9CRUS|nr:Multidrug resistance-associated protein 7 [Armadillidium nasatum]